MRTFSMSSVSKSSVRLYEVIKNFVGRYKEGSTKISEKDKTFLIDVIERRSGAIDNHIITALKKGLIDICIDNDTKGISSLVVPVVQAGNIVCVVNIAEILEYKSTNINDVQDLDGVRFLLYNAYMQQKFYSTPNRYLYSTNVQKGLFDLYEIMFNRVLNKAFNISYLDAEQQDVVEYLTTFFIYKVIFEKSSSDAMTICNSKVYKNKTDNTTLRMRIGDNNLEDILELESFSNVLSLLISKSINHLILIKNWALSFDKIIFGVDTMQVTLGFMYAMAKTQSRTFDSVLYTKMLDYKRIKVLANTLDTL